MQRVRKLLERGIGYVDAQGHVRGTDHPSGGSSGTGRSRLFAGRINALALDIIKLPAFQERKVSQRDLPRLEQIFSDDSNEQEVFKILAGAR